MNKALAHATYTLLGTLLDCDGEGTGYTILLTDNRRVQAYCEYHSAPFWGASAMLMRSLPPHMGRRISTKDPYTTKYKAVQCVKAVKGKS